MTVYAGIIAALLAPFLEAAGFLEWDIHWKRGGGSAFALNMYKCNLAAFGFLVMTVFANNSGYIRYTTEWNQDRHSPYGHKPKGHIVKVVSPGSDKVDDPNDAWESSAWDRAIREEYLREQTKNVLNSKLGKDVGKMLASRLGEEEDPNGGGQLAPLPPSASGLPKDAIQQHQQLQQLLAARHAQQQNTANPPDLQREGPPLSQQEMVQFGFGGVAPQIPAQSDVGPAGPHDLQGGVAGQQQQQVQAAQQRQQHQGEERQRQGQQPTRQQLNPQSNNAKQRQGPPQQQPQQQGQQQQGKQQPPQQQQQQAGPPKQPEQVEAPRRRLQIQAGGIISGSQFLPQDMRYPAPQLRQKPLPDPQYMPPSHQQGNSQRESHPVRQPYPPSDAAESDAMPPPPNLPYVPPDAYRPPPSKFSWEHVGPIVLGSFLGILIGDCAELEALRLIGARRVLIVDTVKPFAAAFLGTIFLGEPLHLAAVLGMILTAYGVFIVLKDSMERLERAVERRKKESAKRALSGGSLTTLSRSGSNGSLNSTDGDGTSGASRRSGTRPKAVMMVGMRRGSISRHDLASEYQDALSVASGFGGYDDDIGLFLEDGRECISPDGGGSVGSFGCGLRRRISSFASMGSGEGYGWGRKDSMGESVGSFDSADYAPYGFDEDDYLDGSRAKGESAQDAASHNVVVEMPFRSQQSGSSSSSGALARSKSPGSTRDPTPHTRVKTRDPTPTRAKSALRKSRFSVTTLTDTDQNQTSTVGKDKDNLVSASDFEKSLIGAIGVSMNFDDSNGSITGQQQQQQLPPIKVPSRTRLGSFGGGGSSSVVSSASFRSMSTIGTECGPPPDWYPGRARETREGREIRLKLGYGLALLNVLFDAYASLLTKQHGSGMTTWEINLIRMGFAGLCMLAISGCLRVRDYLAWRARASRRKRRPSGAGKQRYFDQEWSSDDGTTSGESLEHYHVRAAYAWYRMPSMPMRPWVVVSLGVLFVSFLSPALSNYALFEIAIALAVTLGSVTPLFTLPLGWILKGERPTKQGVVGAGTAALGVVVLCLWGIDAE
eukprot:CAMPEP_0113567196 /NCGR_PEP_ID=MMETSP0015_2-20120614/23137_1 /TAXON_ID=2838 /ORGANISM="Odontella" /LENGTH=1052 /DNA_ID=CAMNT_0000469555 /DNA_START=422 /DNA_END=3580 /DNA_ORIENTATION=- /assembly_acc=CAM_ASM_000160